MSDNWTVTNLRYIKRYLKNKWYHCLLFGCKMEMDYEKSLWWPHCIYCDTDFPMFGIFTFDWIRNIYRDYFPIKKCNRCGRPYIFKGKYYICKECEKNNVELPNPFGFDENGNNELPF